MRKKINKHHERKKRGNREGIREQHNTMSLQMAEKSVRLVAKSHETCAIMFKNTNARVQEVL